MLTREVAESHIEGFRRALRGDEVETFWIRCRIFEPRGIELLDFELAEYGGEFYARLLLVESVSGRRGHIDTLMGPVRDESYGTEEYVRAENVLEDLAQPREIVWE